MYRSSIFAGHLAQARFGPMTTTALIVEDHPLYRGALIHLMRAIVGESATLAASTAEEGLRLLDTLESLSVILLDLGLPGLRGADAISAFRRKCPSAAIVVVSASEDRHETTAAIRAGAKVVLSKSVSMEVMTDVVRRLLSGAVSEPEWITLGGRNAIDKESLLMLTPRQREILLLLTQGHSNKEIGLRLGLAEITVKMHVSAVFRALNVVNRTQAVLAASRFGLYSPEQEN